MQRINNNLIHPKWVPVSQPGKDDPPAYIHSFFRKYGKQPGLPVLIAAEDSSFEEELLREIKKAETVFPPLTRKIILLRNKKKLTKDQCIRFINEGVYDIIDCSDEEETLQYLEALTERVQTIRSVLESDVVTENLIGESTVWKKFLSEIIETALFPKGSILLTGESGTGKELVSRLLHTLDTRPDKKDLILLDCTTIVPDLSGSEFFGHEKGSYTSAVQSRDGAFALANKGTLFLDEIGDLPFPLQAELLRVIQEGTYKKVGSNNWQKTNFRLVCATHRSLRQLVKEQKFRQDLFFRITDFEFRVPSLRERPDDVIPLARYFLSQHFTGHNIPEISYEVQEFLMSRDYEGNVRELKQLVQRIAMKHTGHKAITIGDIPKDYLFETPVAATDQPANHSSSSFKKAILSGSSLWDLKDQAMMDAIQAALDLAGGNKKLAAEKLGVTPRAIQQFLKNRHSA